MATLRVHLFGKTSVQYGSSLITDLPSKAHELFFFLLLHRKKAFTREVLASQLWHNTSTARGKKYLRDTLWRLQSECDAQAGLQLDTVLVMENDWVHIHPQADIWVDAHRLEEAYAAAAVEKKLELDDDQMENLLDAVALYQGEFMEGWYQDWCILVRERLQLFYLTALDRLMACFEIRRRYDEGILYGLTALSYDWARERTHRRLMRLYYLAGDRTTSLRQYERCQAIIKEEFDAQPELKTTTLYRQILSGQPIHRMETPPQQLAADNSIHSLLPDLLEDLRQLHFLLSDSK